MAAGAWVMTVSGLVTDGGLPPFRRGSSSPSAMELLLTIEGWCVMTEDAMEEKGGGEGPVVEVILAPDRSNRTRRL